MSSANPSSKAQRDRLVELEEQLLYLAEVSDSIRFLESRLEEIAEKTDIIDASSGFVAHMKGRVNELDNSQKTILEMINDMSEDFQAILDVVRNEIADVNTRVNLTMRAMANQVPVGVAVLVTKVKVLEPKPFCGVRDAKALENFIFDLEQYSKATNIVTKETKVTLATMHL
ncbi:senescence-specific cysteine protease sag39 [Cucumis melo var. makuwa]|uniref:Senescence-specific cysteine protease sag39 n=1 Tax=Cucumis melo var. makuwa TaxID=1194695 RepID=A0A5D3DYJ7_CUCMM|nr:senescence-specific cysteine protease sag39 [Cucumis melo var. makuwa]